MENGLHYLGINEISAEKWHKLVGIGTDGASANVGGRGLKGLVEMHIPWIFWMWCMAHRLELAVHVRDLAALSEDSMVKLTVMPSLRATISGNRLRVSLAAITLWIF